jgi:hypothetical protein
MKEIRILLNEATFTNLCKSGFVRYNHPETGRHDIPISKEEIKSMTKGNILDKESDGHFRIAIGDFGIDNIKEIIKRSPLYSQLYYEM